MCTLGSMWLAGIPVADRAVLRLAANLRGSELIDTAELLERAYGREARIVALDIPDREAILRVLEDCHSPTAGHNAGLRTRPSEPSTSTADATPRSTSATANGSRSLTCRTTENGCLKLPLCAANTRARVGTGRAPSHGRFRESKPAIGR
jgi:hypothetical protein